VLCWLAVLAGSLRRLAAVLCCRVTVVYARIAGRAAVRLRCPGPARRAVLPAVLAGRGLLAFTHFNHSPGSLAVLPSGSAALDRRGVLCWLAVLAGSLRRLAAVLCCRVTVVYARIACRAAVFLCKGRVYFRIFQSFLRRRLYFLSLERVLAQNFLKKVCKKGVDKYTPTLYNANHQATVHTDAQTRGGRRNDIKAD